MATAGSPNTSISAQVPPLCFVYFFPALVLWPFFCSEEDTLRVLVVVFDMVID
jgi:hypothetical protein